MDFKVKLSQQAVNDIDDIISYISHELYSPQAAERFFNKINQKISLLGKNPFIYPLYHDEDLSKKGLRFVIVGNYLMFYIIDEENTVVHIARIVYGGRNLPVVLEENNGLHE